MVIGVLVGGYERVSMVFGGVGNQDRPERSHPSHDMHDAGTRLVVKLVDEFLVYHDREDVAIEHLSHGDDHEDGDDVDY